MYTARAVAVGVLVAYAAAAQNHGASISGRVEDIRGAVVPGVRTELRSESNPEAVLRGTTNESGVYNFELLTGGDYTLLLTSPGFAHLTLKSLHISNNEHMLLPALQLSVAASCDGGPFVDYLRLLTASVQGGDLGGSVQVDFGPMTENSASISEAQVVLLCGRIPCQTTTTDSQGTFLFKDVPSGEYGIRVSHVGFYAETRPGYAVQPGRELIYYPIYLERCTDCNPKKPPKKPLAVCE